MEDIEAIEDGYVYDVRMSDGTVSRLNMVEGIMSPRDLSLVPGLVPDSPIDEMELITLEECRVGALLHVTVALVFAGDPLDYRSKAPVECVHESDMRPLPENSKAPLCAYDHSVSS